MAHRRRLSEQAVTQIMQTLLEKFGEPIGQVPGDHQAVPSSHHKGKSMGNRGFGDKLKEDTKAGEVNVPTCDECGAMMPLESDSCNQCGAMSTHMDEAVETMMDCPRCGHTIYPNQNPKCRKCGKVVKAPKRAVDESESGGRHPGHAASCTCPDCSRPTAHDDDLDEVAPPGREKQVRALKKNKKVKNPFAVAWSSYNKTHEGVIRERRNAVTKTEVEQTWEDLRLELGQVSLEDLASWLGAPPEDVKKVLHQTHLIVDKNGDVVERGISTPPQQLAADEEEDVR